MGFLSFLKRNKANSAPPKTVVLDIFVDEKLNWLIDDVMQFDNENRFTNRNAVVDFICNKLDLFRSETGDDIQTEELPGKNIVKQNSENSSSKIIKKIKLKPLTTLLD